MVLSGGSTVQKKAIKDLHPKSSTSSEVSVDFVQGHAMPLFGFTNLQFWWEPQAHLILAKMALHTMLVESEPLHNCYLTIPSQHYSLDVSILNAQSIVLWAQFFSATSKIFASHEHAFEADKP